jgi:hypothetical protein
MTTTRSTSSGDGSSHDTGDTETLERVTVNLTPAAYRALERAVRLTGDTRTDTINRALQVYAYLEEITQGSGSIYVRTAPDAEPQRLRIF